MSARRPIFYGWAIVAAGMAVMATAVGIVNNCFGLFVVPICAELGFSREAMGYCQMIFSAGPMLVALMAGPIFSRTNIKRLMCLGACVLCASYFLFPLAGTLPAFYAVSAVVALSQALITFMPFAIIIRNWFCERAGTALGLAFMGSGVGGMLFNLLGGQLTLRMGWRGAMTILAVILTAVVLPCVFLVVRVRPEDMGLVALGGYGRGDAVEGTGRAPDGLGLKQAARTGRFYLLLAGLFVSGLAVNAAATTATPHFTDLLGPAAASAIASGFMACLAFGKFFLGWLFDRLGAKKATILSLTLLTVTLFSLARGASGVFIAAYLLASGVACAFATVPMGLLAERAFGTRDYGAITGVFSAVSSFGGMLAPPVCGRIRDVTGSYAPAYGALAAAALLCALPILVGLKRAGKFSDRINMSRGA